MKGCHVHDCRSLDMFYRYHVFHAQRPTVVGMAPFCIKFKRQSPPLSTNIIAELVQPASYRYNPFQTSSK